MLTKSLSSKPKQLVLVIKYLKALFDITFLYITERFRIPKYNDIQTLHTFSYLFLPGTCNFCSALSDAILWNFCMYSLTLTLASSSTFSFSCREHTKHNMQTRNHKQSINMIKWESFQYNLYMHSQATMLYRKSQVYRPDRTATQQLKGVTKVTYLQNVWIVKETLKVDYPKWKQFHHGLNKKTK